jgi:hypothetical protein
MTMKVQQIITLLSKCDPNAEVSVWNAYDVCESFDVHVSVHKKAPKAVHIGDNIFGEEVTPNVGKGNKNVVAPTI